MITMFLGGLWHGAAWTFIFWGVFHGIALSIDKTFRIDKRVRDANTFYKLLSWASTMVIVMVGWVFFRAQSFGDAWTCLGNMFVPQMFNQGIHWISLRFLICVPLLAIPHILSTTRFKDFNKLPHHRLITPAVLFFLIWMVIIFQPERFAPFVYFQF
jgi:alginate O-acetyltransferase complex protein AlgI